MVSVFAVKDLLRWQDPLYSHNIYVLNGQNSSVSRYPGRRHAMGIIIHILCRIHIFLNVSIELSASKA